MEEQLFFVGIKDPTEVRKELLLSSKALIDSLKRHELYKKHREQKNTYIMELKHVFDELLILNKKVRGHMPRVPVKVPNVARELEETKEKPIKIDKTERSKLDLLEEELAKIESRLGSLE